MTEEKQIVLNKIDTLLAKRTAQLRKELPDVHEVCDGVIIRFFGEWDNCEDDAAIKYKKIPNIIFIIKLLLLNIFIWDCRSGSGGWGWFFVGEFREIRRKSLNLDNLLGDYIRVDFIVFLKIFTCFFSGYHTFIYNLYNKKNNIL